MCGSQLLLVSRNTDQRAMCCWMCCWYVHESVISSHKQAQQANSNVSVKQQTKFVTVWPPCHINRQLHAPAVFKQANKPPLHWNCWCIYKEQIWQNISSSGIAVGKMWTFDIVCARQVEKKENWCLLRGQVIGWLHTQSHVGFTPPGAVSRYIWVFKK